MKRFFYLFILFYGCLSLNLDGFCADLLNQNVVQIPIPLAGEKPTTESEERLRPNMHIVQEQRNFFAQKMLEMQRSFVTKMKQAKDLDAREVSIIEHPENLSVYNLITLLGRDAGLLTGEKGLGEIHQFDFGSARLVSCMGNLDNRPILFTALAVSLLPEWVLQKPNISISHSELWQTEDILYPLRLKKNVKRTDLYTDLVFFPIVYRLTDATKNFKTTKEITLAACRNDECQTQTRLYSLAVDAGKGYQTDICPAIMSDFYAAPAPLPNTVQAAAHRNTEGLIQLNLTFPESISDFNIQIDNPIEFEIQKMFINEKHVNVILKPLSFLRQQEVIHFKLLTSMGWYNYDVVPDSEPFVLEKSRQYDNNYILQGWLFLFFSPFYLLFWSIRPQNKQELSRVFITILSVTCVFVLLMGTIRYYEIPISTFFNQPLILLLQTILIFLLLMKPFIPSKWLGILLLIMPYPFLYNAGVGMVKGNLGLAYGVAVWWGICALLPFILTRTQPIVFQMMNNAEKPIQKIIRLPLIIMFIWMILNTVLSLNYIENDYSEEKLTAALNENKTVFLSVYQSPCISCVANDFAGKYFYPTNFLTQDKKLLYMRLNQSTQAGKEFLSKYNILSGQSFNILYGPDQKYGKRIRNAYIRPEEWFKYLDAVGGLLKEKKEKTEPLKEEDLPLDYQRAIKVLRVIEEFNNQQQPNKLFE